MGEPKEPINSTAADWEGADKIEKDLQDKIQSTMENQEPKIEQDSNEQAKEKLRGALREIAQLYREGLVGKGDIKATPDQLDYSLKQIATCIKETIDQLDK